MKSPLTQIFFISNIILIIFIPSIATNTYALIINLIIAHRHPVFVVILQNLLQSYHGLHVTGKASTANSLLEAASRLKPDVIIADIALPGMEGFTALQQLTTTSQAKIILSWNRDQEAAISEAMLAGCAGCILQEANPTEYYLAIRQAIKGEVFYCDETKRAINTHKNLQPAGDDAAAMLNEKYRMILYCLWLNYKSKDMAIGVKLTKKTIDTYRKKLRKIMGSLSLSAIESLMKKNGLM